MRITKNTNFSDFEKFIKFIQKLKDTEEIININFNGSFDEKRNSSVNVSWNAEEEL